MPTGDPCPRCWSFRCTCPKAKYHVIENENEDREPEADFHHGGEDEELIGGPMILRIRADDASVSIEAATIEEVSELLALAIDAAAKLRRNIQ